MHRWNWFTSSSPAPRDDDVQRVAVDLGCHSRACRFGSRVRSAVQRTRTWRRRSLLRLLTRTVSPLSAPLPHASVVPESRTSSRVRSHRGRGLLRQGACRARVGSTDGGLRGGRQVGCFGGDRRRGSRSRRGRDAPPRLRPGPRVGDQGGKTQDGSRRRPPGSHVRGTWRAVIRRRSGSRWRPWGCGCVR